VQRDKRPVIAHHHPQMSHEPLVLCWGMGQDSTGTLVGMWERGINDPLHALQPFETQEESCHHQPQDSRRVGLEKP